MGIGENIKRKRKEAGLTQHELSTRLDVSPAMISQYENGKRKPKIETVRKIANALDVSFFHLTDGDYSDFSKEELQNNFLKAATPLDEFHKMIVAKTAREENELLVNYRQLNEDGQTEARKRVQELTEIKRYTKREEPLEE